MVLRLLLRIWSGCGALLNGAAVADTKPCRGGDAPYRALSRSTASTLRRVRRSSVNILTAVARASSAGTKSGSCACSLVLLTVVSATLDCMIYFYTALHE